MRYLLILFCFNALFLISTQVNAQTCDESFNSAREYYFRGEFDYVFEQLNTCLNNFNDDRQYYLDYNEGRVFEVYKLIIDSHYESDDYYLADEKKQELINFFDGKYGGEDVISRLNDISFY